MQDLRHLQIDFLIKWQRLDAADAGDKRAISDAVDRMLAAPLGDPSRSA